MAQTTTLHRLVATVKATAPPWIWHPMRSVVTAALTPILFSYSSGHVKSTLKRVAVSRHGEPIPWYSYPCTDFLRRRPFHGKTVLEFGGGQSTLWWAKRASKVVTFEGDRNWLERLQRQVPENVELYHVAATDGAACVERVAAVLRGRPEATYDVIIIDGLHRFDLIDIATERLSGDGMIICDDADGYNFHGGFARRALNRVDFYGHVPGGAFPHVTSIYFPNDSYGFRSSHSIPIATFQ